MDSTVSAALVTMITDVKNHALDLVGDYLPLAGGLLITVAVLFFGIRIFRAIAHV